MKNSFIILVTFGLFTALFSSCRKDELQHGDAKSLSFSRDTVLFDTLFTSVASTTQALLVYNNSGETLHLSEIRLAGGISSPFRINIDGTVSSSLANIEIAAHDSLYVFIRAAINPNNHDNPLVVTDSIVFGVAGGQKQVKLVAWGQDAWFHVHDTIHSEQTLKNNKPHVIYGNLVVARNAILRIDQGTHLYFHNGSGLVMLKGAALKVNGTYGAPVVFEGDRPEHELDSIPGQWEGITMMAGSGNHEIISARIVNARYGIQLDSVKSSSETTLRLFNVVIHNMTNYGIRAAGTSIEAANCEISDCGGVLLAIEKGGSFDFRHCTIANSWRFSANHFASVILNNYAVHPVTGAIIPYNLTKAYFGNCIISGRFPEEVLADTRGSGLFSFLIDHCLVSSTLPVKYPSSFAACILNKSPLFVDFARADYRLTKNSPASNAGSFQITNNSTFNLTRDLLNQGRTIDTAPDLGCYEYND